MRITSEYPANAVVQGRTRTHAEDDRVSIWDVPRGWRDRFWIIFSLLIVLVASFEAWFQMRYAAEPTTWHQLRAIITGTAPYAVLIAPLTYIITEVTMVLSERYLAWRYKKGLEKGLEEGREEGREEGIEQAVTEFRAWLKRRDEAMERGQEFNEPPPWVGYGTSHTTNGSIHSAAAAGEVEQLKNRVRELESTVRESRERNRMYQLLAKLEDWYIRKGMAEDLGEPFNEPHPFRSNGQATPPTP